MVTLSIMGVECRYASVKILENVTFQAEAGELIGVLGPNGAGKTTLLKTISGVLKPNGGVVYVDGRELNRMGVKEVARNIAVVPQDPQTTFNFTAMEIVLMGRNPHMSRLQLESPKDVQLALSSMRLAGVEHLADRMMDEISGGERRLIMIARALAQEPRILLLDEPTLHLDIANQIKVMELLRELCGKRGLLVIAVLHDFNLAARYCDKLLLLSGGRIQATGTPEEALTRENLSHVFGVQVYVKRHEMTNSIYIVPVSASGGKERLRKSLRVHVICGGGTGASLLKALSDQGYETSAGVLNVLDTDYEAAQQVGAEVAVEAPFSPITSAAHRRNIELIKRADIIIVTEFMIGKGNLKNLEAAIEGAKMRKPVVLIGSLGLKQDFTGGIGEKMLRTLKRRGALQAHSGDEALNIVSSLALKK
jgi:iron complex transport system ATP-binding protein